MLEILTCLYSGNTRRLVVPCATDAEETEYARLGWEVVRLRARSKILRQLSNAWGSFKARYGIDRQDEIIRIRGGSPSIPSRLLQRQQAELPGALVWVYRADYWNLIRHKKSGEYWVMDSNDLIANLQQAYGWSVMSRRLFWPSDEALERHLREREKRWISRYDLVLAICRRDAQLLRSAAAAGARIAPFDSCVCTRPTNRPATRDIDIGFLGASHAGSLEAARTLISMAESGRLGERKLVLAGQCGKALPHSGRHFVNLGPVENASAFWARVKFAILPQAQQTGISVKFQEAVLGGALVLAPRGAVEWSKALPQQHYLEYESLEELGRILGRQWSAPQPVLADFQTLRDEIAVLLQGAEV